MYYILFWSGVLYNMHNECVSFSLNPLPTIASVLTKQKAIHSINEAPYLVALRQVHDVAYSSLVVYRVNSYIGELIYIYSDVVYYI